jgi:acyl carrier protein
MRLPLEQMVRSVVAAHLEVPATDISTTQNFFDDLGIPPLGVVLIALDIEDLEGISLPFERLMQTKTVSDLCELVRGAQPHLTLS